jgi:hypothetical protein
MSLFLQILLDDMKLDSIHRPMTSKKIIIQQIVFTQFIPFQVLEPSEDGPQGHVHFTKSKPIAISFVQKGSVAAKTYGIPIHFYFLPTITFKIRALQATTNKHNAALLRPPFSPPSCT